MRASIVVNNFNYERFVGEAIASALAQTHPDTEVVVVDDGSTDGSREVIAAYGDRVRPLLRANAGQSAALSAAMDVVSGDFVIFLDADDALAPGAVARAAAAFADPEVVKVHWPLEEVDADGRPLGGRTPAAPLPSGDLRAAVAAGGPEACVFPPTSGNAFRTRFLRAEMPLPDTPTRIGSASADALLSVLAAVEGHVVALDAPLGRYRLHGRNGFASLPLGERVLHDAAQFDHRCSVLAARCRRLGLPADPAAWRERAWVHRVRAAKRLLEEVLPADGVFVLLDGGEWGTGLVAGRRALPYVERDGEWWGPPADDASAVRELERLRASGARHAVVGWPAFWWLEHFPGLGAHLAACAAEVVRTDDVRVFALAEGA